LLAIFPWTILLVPASKQALRVIRGRHPELHSTLFLLCWVAFPLVFFSVSKSKLPGYILPAIPPLVLLLAASLGSRLGPAEKPARWLVAVLGAGLLGLAIAVYAFSGKWTAPSGILPLRDVRFLAFMAAFAGVAVIVLGLLRGVRVALFALVFFLLLLLVKTGDLLGKLDAALTARSALSEASRNWPEFSPRAAATWGLTRSEAYQLNFYTHSVLPEWQPGDPKPSWLFLNPRERSQLDASSFECLADRIYSAVIPCRNTASVGGLGVLGGSRDDRVRDGQPR